MSSGGAYDFELIDRSTNDTDLRSGIRRAYNILMDDSQDSVCQTIVSAMNRNTTLQHFVIHTVLSEAAIRSRLISRCHDYERVREMINLKVASTQTAFDHMCTLPLILKTESDSTKKLELEILSDLESIEEL
jgi:hypothetical protein